MNRCSFCEWIPLLPWPVWPLAGHARLGQNTVVGSMTILLSWLCWGACQEEVCLDPRFLCNLTLPRLCVELPRSGFRRSYNPFLDAACCFASYRQNVTRCVVDPFGVLLPLCIGPAASACARRTYARAR